MIGWKHLRRILVIAVSTVLTATGCAFQGLNSLPLPGTVDRGTGAASYHVEIANVGALEPNSPVMVDDVVVGSVAAITVEGWHANVKVMVKPEVVIPANAVATIGQTSLLGSMHLQLNPRLGQPPTGRLAPGSTIALNQSSTYPSTEQTLSVLSAVVNAGGLNQLGDILHNFNTAVSGREPQIRDLLNRLDTFVGTLNDQRDNIIATIEAANRFSTTLADSDQVITAALRNIPPALDVLLKQRPRLTEALQKLGHFSDIATRLVNDTQVDLVTNLRNLAPSLCAIADVGSDIDDVLAYIPLFPLTQNLVDRGIRGDYMNLFITVDLTKNRLKRGLGAGTPWFQGDAEQTPAPGDRGYDEFITRNPSGAGGTTPVPPWLASLPEGSPPLHTTGVAPLDTAPPILTLPAMSTPSRCGD